MIYTQTQYDDAYEFCKKYIDEVCIVRNQVMPARAPGKVYTWMFYLRRGLFNPDFARSVSLLFLAKVEKEIGHFNFQLAGLETGSTPLLSAIPLVAKTYNIDINAFSVRKERKSYGLLNWIEGIPNNKPIMLIDDLCNSKETMRTAYNTIRTYHPDLQFMNNAFVVVNKVNKTVHEPKRQTTDMYLPETIKMLYLYDMDDFDLHIPSH
jgi:orotate phosphoribosyltransferase